MQAKIELEKSKFSDKLSGKISRRPTKAELEARNIIKPGEDDDQSADEEYGSGEEEEDEDHPIFDYMPAPSIERITQGSFADRQQQLKSILKKRPDKETLENKNILKGKILSKFKSFK